MIIVLAMLKSLKKPLHNSKNYMTMVIKTLIQYDSLGCVGSFFEFGQMVSCLNTW
jgi:hypothetical protein